MKTTNKYLKTNNNINIIQIIECLEFLKLCENDNLSEGITDNVKSLLSKIGDIIDNNINPVAKKAGMHIETKKGLLHYLSNISTNSAKLLYYAVSYAKNKNNNDKEKIKEIFKKVNKEDFIDFILKLDMVTLHLLTEPIHMIDAITGTHIWSNVKSKAQKIDDVAHKAISTIENLKDKLEGKLQIQLQNYANALRRIFELGGFKKVNEETVGSDIAEPDIKIGDKSPVIKDKNVKCKKYKKYLKRRRTYEIS